MPCAPLPPVSLSPVQGKMPFTCSPVQFAAVLQSGQCVHSFHHQLQQVTHLAEDATGLRTTHHCTQSMATVSLEATWSPGRGGSDPSPIPIFPERGGIRRGSLPPLTPVGQESRQSWANPASYQFLTLRSFIHPAPESPGQTIEIQIPRP